MLDSFHSICAGLLMIALTGCASEQSLLLNVSRVDLVLPTGSDTDYQLGQVYKTRRELLAKRQPVGLWGSEFQLTGQDSQLSEAETRPYWSVTGYRLPDVVVVHEDTTLKIVTIEPAAAGVPGAVPRIYAEVQTGPLAGKRVSLAGISREKRLVDLEFLTLDVRL